MPTGRPKCRSTRRTPSPTAGDLADLDPSRRWCRTCGLADAIEYYQEFWPTGRSGDARVWLLRPFADRFPSPARRVFHAAVCNAGGIDPTAGQSRLQLLTLGPTDAAVAKDHLQRELTAVDTHPVPIGEVTRGDLDLAACLLELPPGGAGSYAYQAAYQAALTDAVEKALLLRV